jgi:hypothetical protein
VDVGDACAGGDAHARERPRGARQGTSAHEHSTARARGGGGFAELLESP